MLPQLGTESSDIPLQPGIMARATVMRMARPFPRIGYRVPLRRFLQTAAAPNTRASDFAFAFE